MALPKLRDLAAKAGRWLGLSAPAARHTTAVPGDRFDDMTWQEIRDQAQALRDLTEELSGRHDYADDLIRDMFLAAYKVAPEVRDPDEMDPSRLINRQIVASLLAAPEFADLRRETAGDQYAAAMAVIAQAEQLRRMTEKAREAQQAADAAAKARQEAQQAREAVQQAMAGAEGQARPDGTVPDTAAQAVEQAVARAAQADQAAEQTAGTAGSELEAAAAGMRTAARQAADQAAREAREEADLMDAWGIGPGELQRMDFEQRRRLAERLRNGRLGNFATLIGRFRRMAAGERARKVEGVPGELTGITLSDDLSALIPSELAALAVPAARAVFAARLAEHRLFAYETAGEERAGQGAIIAVLDSSGSMGTEHEGVTREAWSKALALALLDQARAARRDMAVIHFGSKRELRLFRFPAGRLPAIGDVIEMAEFFFNGGTDFEAPLGMAADLLEAEFNESGRPRGDITFVTDGECGVSEEFMRSWLARKERAGFRAWGVSLARQPTAIMDALCDNVRGIQDLTEPAALRDMFRVI